MELSDDFSNRQPDVYAHLLKKTSAAKATVRRTLQQAIPGEDYIKDSIARTNRYPFSSNLFVLTADAKLSAPLPKFTGSNFFFTLTGKCGGKPRCTIDGVGRFPIFVMSPAVKSCTIFLRSLTIQGAVGLGVLQGPCSVYATDVVFQNNSASSGAPAINVVSTTVRLVRCQFINNRALQGNGGAVSVSWSGVLGSTPYALPTLNILDSAFSGNRAPSGSGGGLYFRGDSLRMGRVTFSSNLAGAAGGAVSAAVTRSFLSLAVGFTKNSAGARGGALTLVPFKPSSAYAKFILPFQFCNNTFNPNVLSSMRRQNGVYLADTSGVATGQLRSCRSAFVPVIGPTPKGKSATWSTIATCVGCSGCTDDCGAASGAGHCTLGLDFAPYCKCSRPQFNPGRACGACLDAYTPSSNCTQCTAGFVPVIPPPTPNVGTICRACEGLGLNSYFPKLTSSFAFLTKTSFSQCQALCNSTFVDPAATGLKKCRFWAFYTSSSGSCPNKCILYNGRGTCGVGTVNEVKTAFYDYFAQNLDVLCKT